ncbi:acyl carrier protein [Pseudomonas sp.]|uniref:acyl carrier protein n=1 Tax=Pseudomonas sp. TaxID=306 RepID=UPI002CF0A474|nr:acyl carrier protein [Pseudomonas sp.]HUE91254.1 acyl carrier protein [Pseudomonas sp.]
MRDIAQQTECDMVATLNDNTVLLDSGLDSMGFAILVASLEEQLGYDPFSLMDEPIYPRTLGEFVAIYQRYTPR